MSGFLCSPISEDKMMSYIYDDVDDSDIFALEPNINCPENDAKESQSTECPRDCETAPNSEILKENELLKETISKLTEEKELLERRISEVYKTAKAEIDRKDRRLRDLNEEKNNLIFRRNPNGFRNRQNFINTESNNEVNRVNRDSPKDSIDLRNRISQTHTVPKPDRKNRHESLNTEYSISNKPRQPGSQNPSTIYSERVPSLKKSENYETSTEVLTVRSKMEFKKDTSRIENITDKVGGKSEIPNIGHKTLHASTIDSERVPNLKNTEKYENSTKTDTSKMEYRKDNSKESLSTVENITDKVGGKSEIPNIGHKTLHASTIYSERVPNLKNTEKYENSTKTDASKKEHRKDNTKQSLPGVENIMDKVGGTSETPNIGHKTLHASTIYSESVPSLSNTENYENSTEILTVSSKIESQKENLRQSLPRVENNRVPGTSEIPNVGHKPIIKELEEQIPKENVETETENTGLITTKDNLLEETELSDQNDVENLEMKTQEAVEIIHESIEEGIQDKHFTNDEFQRFDSMKYKIPKKRRDNSPSNDLLNNCDSVVAQKSILTQPSVDYEKNTRKDNIPFTNKKQNVSSTHQRHEGNTQKHRSKSRSRHEQIYCKESKSPGRERVNSRERGDKEKSKFISRSDNKSRRPRSRSKSIHGRKSREKSPKINRKQSEYPKSPRSRETHHNRATQNETLKDVSRSPSNHNIRRSRSISSSGMPHTEDRISQCSSSASESKPEGRRKHRPSSRDRLRKYSTGSKESSEREITDIYRSRKRSKEDSKRQETRHKSRDNRYLKHTEQPKIKKPPRTPPGSPPREPSSDRLDRPDNSAFRERTKRSRSVSCDRGIRRRSKSEENRFSRRSRDSSNHRGKRSRQTPPGSPPREPHSDRLDRQDKSGFREHKRRSRSVSCDRGKHRRSGSKENMLSHKSGDSSSHRGKRSRKTPPGSPPREPHSDRLNRQDKSGFREHKRRSRSVSCNRGKHRRSDSKENMFSHKSRDSSIHTDKRSRQTPTRGKASADRPNKTSRERDRRRSIPERGIQNGRIHRQSVARDSPFRFNRKAVQSRLRERESRREMLREACRSRDKRSLGTRDNTKGFTNDDSKLELGDLSVSNMDEEALERLLAEKQKMLKQASKLEPKPKSDAESGELTDDDDDELHRVKSKVEKIENNHRNKRKSKSPNMKKGHESIKENVKSSESVDLKWQAIGGENVINYPNVLDVKQRRKNVDENSEWDEKLAFTEDRDCKVKDDKIQERRSRYEKYITEKNKSRDHRDPQNNDEVNKSSLAYEKIFKKTQSLREEALAFDLIKKEKIHAKLKECIEPFTKEDAESIKSMATFFKKANEIFVFEVPTQPNCSKQTDASEKTSSQPVIQKKKIGLDAYKKRQCGGTTIENTDEIKKLSDIQEKQLEIESGSKKTVRAKSKDIQCEQKNYLENSVDSLVTKPDVPAHVDTIVEKTAAKQILAEEILKVKSPENNQVDLAYKDSSSFLQDFELSDDEDSIEQPIECNAKKETKINILDVAIIRPSDPSEHAAAIQEIKKAEVEIVTVNISQDNECIEQIQEAVYMMTGEENQTCKSKAKQVLNTEELERCLEEEVNSGCQMVETQLARKQAELSEKASEVLRDLENQAGHTPEKMVVQVLKGTREKLIDIFGSPLSSCSPLAPKTPMETMEEQHPVTRVKRNIAKDVSKATKKQQEAKKNLTADEVLLHQVKPVESKHSQSLNTEKPVLTEIQKQFAFFNSPCHMPLMPFPPKSVAAENTAVCNQSKASSDSESSSDLSEASPIKPVGLKKKRVAKKEKIKIKMNFGGQSKKNKTPEKSPQKVQSNKRKRPGAANKKSPKRKQVKKPSKKVQDKKISSLKADQKGDSAMANPKIEKAPKTPTNDEKASNIENNQEKSENTPITTNDSGKSESVKTPIADPSDESHLRRSVRAKKPSKFHPDMCALPETPRSDNTIRTPKRITPMKVGEVDKRTNMFPLDNVEKRKRKSDDDIEEVPASKISKIENKLPQIMETYTTIQGSENSLSSLTKIQQMSEEILNKSFDADTLPKTIQKSPFKMPFDLSLQDESFSHIKTLHIEESSMLLNMFDPDIQQLVNLCPNSDKSLFSNEEKKGDSPKGSNRLTNFANCLDVGDKAFTSTPIKVIAKCDAPEKVVQKSSSDIGVSINVNTTKNYINKPLKRDRRRKVGMVMFDIT